MEQFFLSLIKLGIGNAKAVPVPNQIDWKKLEDLAAQQGLSAILIDGIERLPEDIRPPKLVLLQWIGETLQGFEYRYESYCRAIAELAGFYNQHGFKMMLLKGYACSLDWPKPEHRPCGDIDIWLFGEQMEADAALTAWFKVQDCPSDEPAHARNNSSKLGSPLAQSQPSSFKIDTSHHHHTVFYWRDFMVENHYDFINIYHHKSHVAYEAILKELGKDDSQYVELYGEKVYLPSPNLHALFLLKHAMLHFVGTELTFRHILDWAFFVKRHGKDVDWKMVLGVLEEHGMMPMFNILNAICVENLGFETSIFPSVWFDPFVKERVLREIFASVYQDDANEDFLTRQVNRYRRWRSSGWKHDLCYSESRWSAFWSSVWGHLLKPGSI